MISGAPLFFYFPSMKFATLLASLLLVISPALRAQSSNANGSNNGNGSANASANGNQNVSRNDGGNANQDWANLLVLTTAVQTTPLPPGQAKTLAQAEAEKGQKAAAAVQAAQAAKDYYTSYPTDAHAPEARKVEAVQALLGVTDGNKAQEQSAKQIATAYRNDPTNSVSDRFDVAVLAERVDSRAILKGSLDVENAAELEKIAAKLRRSLHRGYHPTCCQRP